MKLLLVTHTGKITVLPGKLFDAGIHRKEKTKGGLHIYGRANVLHAATLEALSHKPTKRFHSLFKADCCYEHIRSQTTTTPNVRPIKSSSL